MTAGVRTHVYATLLAILAQILVIVAAENGGAYSEHDASQLLGEQQHMMLVSDSGQDISHLVFEPSILDFEELHIGDADSDVVTVFNKHPNRSVYLGSISGNVPDFYSSFFEEKVIPPNGNTTFNVVFLPRQQGAMQTHLLIHTSFGVLNYLVKGRGAECMFRLTPLVGLKAPFNATLTPEIFLYNPYSTPLQIMEVYSSGGQFQLELPTGGPEGPQALWAIPPYSSKPVIRVRFTATTPGNHTAYIRIKISTGGQNDTELQEVVMVVPIEVEIANQHGIYSDTPLLNFGIGGSEDTTKTMTIDLFNSGRESLRITSYAVEGELSTASGISLSLQQHSEDKLGRHSTIMATVDWSQITNKRYFRGSISVTSTQRNVENVYRVPFVGEIIPGRAFFNTSLTTFGTLSNQKSKTKALRDFVLHNRFEVPLAVTNVTLPDDCSKYFRAIGFNSTLLKPGQEMTLFRIQHLAAATKKATLRHMVLHTNASTYEIPVSSYDGLLRRLVPVDINDVRADGIDEKVINFGTLPLSTLSDMMMAFVNENPIPISIEKWKGSVDGSASIVIILRGCGSPLMSSLKFCFSVAPGEWIFYQVSVLSNAVGTFYGTFEVNTDYETITTDVKFSTAMGRLNFNALQVNESQCFPVSSIFNLIGFLTKQIIYRVAYAVSILRYIQHF